MRTVENVVLVRGGNFNEVFVMTLFISNHMKHEIQSFTLLVNLFNRRFAYTVDGL